MKHLMLCSSLLASLPILGALGCSGPANNEVSAPVSTPQYTLHIGATLVDSATGDKISGNLGVPKSVPGPQTQPLPATTPGAQEGGPLDIGGALADGCMATVTSAKGVALYPGTPTEADIAAQVGQDATLTISCPEGNASQTAQATLDNSNEVDLNFGNVIVDFPVATLFNDASTATVDTSSTLNIAGTVTFQAVDCDATPHLDTKVSLDPISGLVTVIETLSSSTYGDRAGAQDALCATLLATSSISLVAGSPYTMKSSGNVYTFTETITPGSPIDNLVFNIDDQVKNPANSDTYSPQSRETLTIIESNTAKVNFGNGAAASADAQQAPVAKQ